MQTEKFCIRCEKTLPISEFNNWNNPKSADGKRVYCRWCERKMRVREVKTKSKSRFRSVLWKRKAQGKARRAAYAGKIEKPDVCAFCEEKKRVEAHHFDYTKPLDIAWLCHSCHMLVHMIMR